MKNISLKSIAILVALITLQTGCNNDKAKFEKAKQVEITAETAMHSGNADVAIKLFGNSISLLRELQNPADSLTDTVYNEVMAKIYNKIGLIKDSLNNMQEALTYYREANKLARISKMPSLRVHTAENISMCYMTLGKAKTITPGEQKNNYMLAGKAMLTACKEIDSAGATGESAITVYDNAVHLFDDIGDTLDAKIYAGKYLQLRQQTPARLN